MNGLRIAALALFCFASMAFTAADESSYPIKLRHIAKVGDTYDTHVVYEQSQTTTITTAAAAPQAQGSGFKIDLTGRAEVKEVTDKGVPKSLSITITKFVDKDEKELLAPGKILDIQRGPTATTYTLQGGGTIPNNLKAMLSLIYKPFTPDQFDEEEIYGSEAARKVGDNWPINAKAAASTISRDGPALKPEDLKGQVTLKGAEIVNGAASLRIAANLSFPATKPPVPANLVVDDSVILGQFTGTFPLDPATPARDFESTIDNVVKLSGKGEPVKVEIRTHELRKETLTPVKK